MESLENIQPVVSNSNNFQSSSEIIDKKFQIVNKIGLIYALGSAIVYQIGEIYYSIFYKYFNTFSKTYKSDLSLIITLLSIHLTGTPLIFLLTKIVKKAEVKKNKYGCKKYFATYFIESALSITAGIIEVIVETLYSLIFKKKVNKTIFKLLLNDKKNILTESNIFLSFFVVCLTGPISEEFIFRKFLIDRLAIYSKTLAIFSSGIMFGIFHSNFNQLFPATLSGWVLAYSYAETGNILIPISYHIFWNTSLNVITSFAHLDEKEPLATYIIILVLIKLIGALIGIVLLIKYRKKIKISGEENKSKDKWKFFKSYGMWIYILEGFMLFCIFYTNKLILPDLFL